MIDPLHLTAFIASRVCHDFSPCVTSVSHALEFMEETTDEATRASAEEILKRGAKDGYDRLMFLRYAFGSQGLSHTAADIHEAKQKTEAFAATYKDHKIEWDHQASYFSFAHARLMMNLVMIGIDSLPFGGTVQVATEDAGGRLSIKVAAKGERAKIRPETAATLGGGEPEEGWSPQTVQPLFAKLLAEDLGAELKAAPAPAGGEILISAIGVRAGA